MEKEMKIISMAVYSLRRALLEKVIMIQLCLKSFAFYGPRHFTAAFTRADLKYYS